MWIRNASLSLILLIALAWLAGCSSPSNEEAGAQGVSGGAEQSAVQVDDPEVQAVVDAWLERLDAGDHEATWAMAGSLFKAELSAEQWGEAMAEMRENMGAVTQRRLHEYTVETIMPGVPEGRYAMFEYRSVFEKQDQGAELVVCAREEGEWRVVGYFVQ
ncbi:DUF4019 domain-containing protein [Thioalkalivibrio sulfidiphilus]|uniref:DUF4019 domain-containing protein n=1 Tax=Thioalkalivibrio sulfidiphilus (strain HL-EbGR7) TaxID=396588 RepID=B8GU58_THISH|nr:DUF4019 domain-containing protein [Thioalkalivibrio sulfidiphilus]ACL71341.1 hypothetical protein Tgr7_0242 [Thioalkalivibrio sulfidiphilus HL-EbGr7]